MIYIAIGYLLFAGTPFGTFMAERAVGGGPRCSPPRVGVFAMLTLFKIFTHVSLGIQRIPSFGSYGPSGRSVITAIAIVS